MRITALMRSIPFATTRAGAEAYVSALEALHAPPEERASLLRPVCLQTELAPRRERGREGGILPRPERRVVG